MEGASTCAAGHGWNCDPFPETKIACDAFCIFSYQNMLQMNFCNSCIGFANENVEKLSTKIEYVSKILACHQACPKDYLESLVI